MAKKVQPPKWIRGVPSAARCECTCGSGHCPIHTLLAKVTALQAENERLRNRMLRARKAAGSMSRHYLYQLLDPENLDKELP